MVFVSLVWLLLCVHLPSDVLAEYQGWAYLLHRNAEYKGRVALRHISHPDVTHRERRAIDSGELLPFELTFDFDVGGDVVILSLRRNQHMETSPPLFFFREGKLVREKGDLIETGSYFHNGEEYFIHPIRDVDGGGDDHQISKLVQDDTVIDELTGGYVGVKSERSDENGNDVDDGANNESGNDDNYVIAMYLPDDNNTNLSTESVQDEANKTEEGYGSTPISDKKWTIQENGGNFTASEESSVVESKASVRALDVAMSSSEDKNRNTAEISSDSDNDEVRNDSIAKWNDVVSEEVKKSDEDEDSTEGDVPSRGSRKRREAETYVVELLMVIDYGVYEVWFNGVTDKEGAEKKDETLRRMKQFYSFVLNGIDLRYNSVQRLSTFEIGVTWAGIIIFDSPDDEYWTETEGAPKSSRDFVESSAALEAFRAWAGRQGAELPPSDHVMLFTGHNLTYGGSVSNAGLAYLGSACNPDYFFSIVEEYFEFRDVAVAAHELGHSLGARHDMDGNTCLSFDRYIMTSRFKFPSLRKAQNPWQFSQCSVDYFNDFIDGLDRNGTNCLVTNDATNSDKDIQPFLVSLPGEVYSGDDFCRLGDGSSSFICRDQHVEDYSNICYGGIFCYNAVDNKCIPKLPPQGFSCGNRKWCINGTCQSSDLAPATVGDDCPFGDDPGLIGGKTCAERMLTSRFDCYADAFRAKCCASCRRNRRNLPGCEYGDLFELCKANQCVNYDKDYALENCCDTCAELLFTIPTTVATTTPQFNYVTTTLEFNQNRAGLTTRETGVTSGTGERTGRGNGERERIYPPPDDSREDERRRGDDDDDEEGRTGGAAGGISSEKTFSSRNPHFETSEESEDSDEKPRKRYRNQNNPRYRQGQRKTQRDRYRINERMGRIRSLLGAMKDARDFTRLQRVRLLMYVLGRTRPEDLAELTVGIRANEGRQAKSRPTTEISADERR